MTFYVFEADDGSGDVLERSYPIGKAPKIGSSILHRGRRWRRVPCVPGGIVKKTPYFASSQLPRGQQYGPDGKPMYREMDSQGQPVFTTKREVDELVAKGKDISHPSLKGMVWDD